MKVSISLVSFSDWILLSTWKIYNKNKHVLIQQNEQPGNITFAVSYQSSDLNRCNGMNKCNVPFSSNSSEDCSQYCSRFCLQYTCKREPSAHDFKKKKKTIRKHSEAEQERSYKNGFILHQAIERKYLYLRTAFILHEIP